MNERVVCAFISVTLLAFSAQITVLVLGLNLFRPDKESYTLIMGTIVDVAEIIMITLLAYIIN
jgi:hypothetical protein